MSNHRIFSSGVIETYMPSYWNPCVKCTLLWTHRVQMDILVFPAALSLFDFLILFWSNPATVFFTFLIFYRTILLKFFNTLTNSAFRWWGNKSRFSATKDFPGNFPGLKPKISPFVIPLFPMDDYVNYKPPYFLKTIFTGRWIQKKN